MYLAVVNEAAEVSPHTFEICGLCLIKNFHQNTSKCAYLWNMKTQVFFVLPTRKI